MTVFDENIPGFQNIMDFIGNQMVQGPNESFSASLIVCPVGQ